MLQGAKFAVRMLYQSMSWILEFSGCRIHGPFS